MQSIDHRSRLHLARGRHGVDHVALPGRVAKKVLLIASEKILLAHVDHILINHRTLIGQRPRVWCGESSLLEGPPPPIKLNWGLIHMGSTLSGFGNLFPVLQRFAVCASKPLHELLEFFFARCLPLAVLRFDRRRLVSPGFTFVIVFLLLRWPH